MSGVEYEEPAVSKGMRRVSKEEFFERIGQGNIHPRVVSNYSNETGYVSEWRTQDYTQRLIGVSDGGTYLCPKRHWLCSTTPEHR